MYVSKVLLDLYIRSQSPSCVSAPPRQHIFRSLFGEEASNSAVGSLLRVNGA